MLWVLVLLVEGMVEGSSEERLFDRWRSLNIMQITEFWISHGSDRSTP